MQANQANVTFNTHKAVKALKSSGFDEKQAEAVVETIDKAVNETVATKSDLALLEKTVKAEIAKLETRMMRMMWFQSTVLVGMLITVIGMLAPVVAKLL